MIKASSIQMRERDPHQGYSDPRREKGSSSLLLSSISKKREPNSGPRETSSRPPSERELTPLVEKIAESFLRPNLTFNKDETEERKKSARERANPVYFQVKRGEVIVRAGDRIQEENLLKIKAIRKAQESGYVVSILIGIGLLTFLDPVQSLSFLDQEYPEDQPLFQRPSLSLLRPSWIAGPSQTLSHDDRDPRRGVSLHPVLFLPLSLPRCDRGHDHSHCDPLRGLPSSLPSSPVISRRP